MDIIVVGASDDQSDFVLGFVVLTMGVDIGEMGEGFKNGVEIVVIFGFEVRPSFVESVDNLL